MPARLADGLEQWKCSSSHKTIRPKNLVSPRRIFRQRLRQHLLSKIGIYARHFFFASIQIKKEDNDRENALGFKK